MKYTVLIHIPAPMADDIVPKPGETLPIQVVETGCTACMMDHMGKLKVCWKHTHDRILWGRTVEVEDEVQPQMEEAIIE